jgi:hypothetical protein
MRTTIRSFLTAWVPVRHDVMGRHLDWIPCIYPVNRIGYAFEDRVYAQAYPCWHRLPSGRIQERIATLRILRCESRLRCLRYIPFFRKRTRQIHVTFNKSVGVDCIIRFIIGVCEGETYLDVLCQTQIVAIQLGKAPDDYA